jgi:steroid 5-alpha reductase family enzyme
MLAVAALVAASAWLGILLFHTAVVASAAFQVLDREEAGAVVRRIFPRYHAVGLVLGAGAGVAAAGAHAAGPGRWAAYALLVAALVTVGSWRGLIPPMEEARTQGEDERFRRLHGLSMALNLGVILLVAGGVAGLGLAMA